MRYCPRCAGDLVEKVLGDQASLLVEYVFNINPKAAAGVLVEQDGHILLVRRSVEPSRASWNLPLGRKNIAFDHHHASGSGPTGLGHYPNWPGDMELREWRASLGYQHGR